MDGADRQRLCTTLVRQYIDDWAALNPHVAISSGLHQYDGQVPDWSPQAIARGIATLHATSAQLSAVLEGCTFEQGMGDALWQDPAQVALWDARLVYAHARAETFRWSQWRPHTLNPLSYLAALDVSVYIKRNYAPLEQRVDALIKHIAAIPDILQAAHQNLREDLPRLTLEQSIPLYDGLARFHGGDLLAIVRRTHDPDRAALFMRVNRQAIAAYHEFARFLSGRLRHADDRIALGAPLLRGLIAAQEGIDLPIEELLAIGMADLERNHARMNEVAGKLGMAPGTAMLSTGRNHPPAEQLLTVTRAILEDLRRFLSDRQMVSLPAELRCLVQETPPFMRNGSAFMDAPGPFEKTATDAFFYLTLPDPAWTPQQRESWLAKQSIPGLSNTSIHEAWPGHYLQFLHLAQSQSDAARLFTCTSFIEGWAHYAEQMMVENGYHGDDPRYELHQLSMALLRDCRLIVAIRLHTEDMSIAEAADFIAREAFFSPIRARQEALRGARDPGYLNYTLGKLLLLQLRADLRQRYPHWSAQRLHDTILGAGAPPFPLLRELLLGPPQSAAQLG